MTKSPSSGRIRPRAVPELIPCCRCGVLFPKTNGRKEKRFCFNDYRAEELRFCSKHCQGQHAVETRHRRLNVVSPHPVDELAFVIDDGGHRLIAARWQVDVDDRKRRSVALPECEADDTGN
jgi:hypothetical protein